MIENKMVVTMTANDLKSVVREVVNEVQTEKHRSDYGPYLSIAELAELLRCSKQTIYQRTCKGEIPGMIKEGQRIIFSSDSILKWVDDRAIPTATEKYNELRQHRKVRIEG